MEIKYLYIFIFLALCVSGIQSGLILDKLSDVASGVKCNLHKVGNSLHYHHHHHHDPCAQQGPHRHHPNELEESSVFKDNEDTNYALSTPSSTTSVYKSVSTSEKAVIPDMQSRTLIKAGANCPEGYSADKSGTCREEY